MLLSYIRTGVLYLLLIVAIRLMGKRQVGQMEPAEFVVTMLMANLASIPMQDGGIPLLSGLVPILTVLGLELVLSFLSLRSIRLRKLLCGKPVILIENGRIIQDNLRRTSLTIDELTGHLRLKDILDLGAVQYAILETNGDLSVFPFPRETPAKAKDAGIAAKPQYLPITIIDDGRILKDNLRLTGKSLHWLMRVLGERGLRPEETWLFTIDNQDHMVCIPKEVGK